MSKITSQFEKFTRDSDFKQLMVMLINNDDPDTRMLAIEIISNRYKDLGKELKESELENRNHVYWNSGITPFISTEELWKIVNDKGFISNYRNKKGTFLIKLLI